jgi:hypothetical protein
LIAYYGSTISKHMTQTPEGFLICRDVPIARIGTQGYLARELGLDGEPDRPVTVERRPEDVFDPAAIASFEGKDVTYTHPPEMLAPENQSSYSKGHAENVRREGDFLVADLHLKDPTLISEVRNGILREVSCGYLCDYTPSGAGYRQTNIRGNHIAIVPRGRAGHDVAIKDSAAGLPAEKGKVKHMSKNKSLLSLFGLASKDATPEQLDNLVETAAAALDADPAAPAQEAAPAEDNAPPTANTQENPLIAALNSISAKLDKLLAEKEAPAADEGADIDKAISELSGEGGEKETADAAAPAVSVKIDDSGLSLLKAMRPLINGVQDKATRDALSKTLIEQVKGQSAVEAIAHAAQDAAAAAASTSGKNRYEQLCEASQNAYDSRNPHMKKEV